MSKNSLGNFDIQSLVKCSTMLSAFLTVLVEFYYNYCSEIDLLNLQSVKSVSLLLSMQK